MELATFAAGCFWGVEAQFRRIEGVVDSEVGYTGGSLEAPGYREVCSGRTGHAEAVQLRFDPQRIRYSELLDAFWAMHDPTQLDRQGPDVGSQYRSAIFTHDQEQLRQAQQSLAEQQASGRWKAPIVTVIEAAGTFWRAEEYHQRYLERNGGSCHL